jgi:hypothetical protein
MKIEEISGMKFFRLFAFTLLAASMSGCGFFKDYSKGSTWSYFEEWDANVDFRIDKEEFFNGCVKDHFVEKDAQSSADTLFNKADEDKDGLLTSIEFYRWKIGMPEDTRST